MTSPTVRSIRRAFGLLAAAALAILGGSCAGGPGKSSPGESFATPEEPVNALVQALKTNDVKRLEGLFGVEGVGLLASGDEVSDQADRLRFVGAFEESHQLEKISDDETVIHVGKDDWPFPIPLVRDGGRWSFDTDAGAEEIINRRIGRNELNTIQVCLAFVDAEREYALEDRNGDGVLEYAQKIRSTPGKKDGLFWPTQEGEPPSPLGPLAARAVEEGYQKPEEDEPAPYHGYLFRILTSQGDNAPGGAFDYMIGGHMAGGFALVAFPAEYGSSGIMTFLVNNDGVVFQKDLGEGTEKAALAIKSFDPDSSWKKAE
jgi:DUF2950 family protein